MTERAFFTELTHEGILAVRGPDAAKFLQGQLTCNLDYLSAERSSLGARCTAKGRMFSSFRILQQGDGFLLVMDAALVEPQLNELQKYAVFSKCTLIDESDRWTRYGIYQPDAAALEGPEFAADMADNAVRRGEDDQWLSIRLDRNRWQLWRATPGAAPQGLEQGSSDAWKLAQIRAGEGMVCQQTSELFIPQMLNLQALGGVSFRKGCYTGQEIVARMQYLGKLKRRMYRLAATTDNLPEPGAALYAGDAAGSVGNVVLAAPTGNGMELLAVVQNDAVEGNSLKLDPMDADNLQMLDLPYELDADRDIQT